MIAQSPALASSALGQQNGKRDQDGMLRSWAEVLPHLLVTQHFCGVSKAPGLAKQDSRMIKVAAREQQCRYLRVSISLSAPSHPLIASRDDLCFKRPCLAHSTFGAHPMVAVSWVSQE